MRVLREAMTLPEDYRCECLCYLSRRAWHASIGPWPRLTELYFGSSYRWTTLRGDALEKWNASQHRPYTRGHFAAVLIVNRLSPAFAVCVSGSTLASVGSAMEEQ
jgi:hypothetical protein